MKIIRVFPHKTKATPIDKDAFIGDPTLFAEADRIIVSCTFTWDMPEVERLAEAWKWIAPTKLGGPAYGDVLGEFTPGKFIGNGYTITSRGCPNKCWFCYVWKRCKGEFQELEIKDGWIIQDDNFLACSDQHIKDVFAMLKKQPKKAVFSGGLEARLLQDWHVELLHDLKPARMYFAYDTPGDYEPLVNASILLKKANLLNHNSCCYCLIGYPNDTFEKAEKRMMDVLRLGYMPFAMLWRDDKGKTKLDWRKLQREWTRPEIIYSRAL